MDNNSLYGAIERRVVTCSPHTSLRAAIVLMQQQQCRYVIVIANGVAQGIWAEQDTLKIGHVRSAAFDASMSDVMNLSVDSVNVALSSKQAAFQLSAAALQYLVVFDDVNNVIGIVTQKALATQQGSEWFSSLTQVKSVLPQHQAPLIDANETLQHAIYLMKHHHCELLVVTMADKPSGLLSQRDVVNLMLTRSQDSKVISFIGKSLITVPHDTCLLSVRTFMEQLNIRHIAVNESDEYLGIVSMDDLINNMEKSYVNRLRDALADSHASLQENKQSLQMANALIEASVDGIMVTCEKGIIHSVNTAFTQLTGYEKEDVVGKFAKILNSGRQSKSFYQEMWQSIMAVGRWQGEIWNRRKNGETYPEWLTITKIQDPASDSTMYAGIFSDITDRKKSELLIKNLAYYDPLTKLPNRQLLFDRLDTALVNAHKKQCLMAVLFIDLDHFKRINDSLGHSVGDKVLCEVSQRIAQCISETDTLARIGGDEFVILLHEVADQDDVYRVAQQVVESLNSPLQICERELFLTTSVGCSIYPQDGQSREELLKNSDTAMYRAKSNGRNRFCFYSAEMNEQSKMKLALENRLHSAVENGELFLEYQPKVDTHSHKIVAVEALVRWQDKVLGRVAPDLFIGVAEDIGLISEIGRWVLKEAMMQGQRWLEQGMIPLKIAVNASVKQFTNQDFVQQIRDLLEETGLNPHQLDIEVTESNVTDDLDFMFNCLKEIRELGIGVSMDDFGTGYSSLSMLTKMPLDQLKIDRAFIDGIPDKKECRELVSTIIVMAHNLGLTVVAEGVETTEQLMFLKDHKCEQVQGYLFSKPVSADAIFDMVNAELATTTILEELVT